ncbi:hypothetical protein SODALDRAFT_22839 [Sodiomyces alkalinus F11]|uniref:Transmembrane protein n=1 Tax=Sodiomyces alkalinus (strain CBS 110278 / VKM F-3762 / F11) TaxID=1314773 RepID=A0A3N2Q7L0_SODAK|nr:hypothetical protein SODALDRAFT_22839 [Sodiomyces alkalinus F11]ROT42754.1 hypothetical protein SODALDRAFT_22839 [Sodiomyces alkalinus F11]
MECGQGKKSCQSDIISVYLSQSRFLVLILFFLFFSFFSSPSSYFLLLPYAFLFFLFYLFLGLFSFFFCFMCPQLSYRISGGQRKRERNPNGDRNGEMRGQERVCSRPVCWNLAFTVRENVAYLLVHFETIFTRRLM